MTSTTIVPAEHIQDHVPQVFRGFSVWFCEYFGINGICDPMYVVNVVARMTGTGDGCGNFGPNLGDKLTDPAEDIAKRLTFAYSTCIVQAGSELPDAHGLIREVIRGLAHRPKRLTCCCCGESTTGRQWHNRDTGFGLCPGCIEFCRRSYDLPGFTSCYGVRGVHFDVGGSEE